ncbi:MAG: protein DA1 [Limisphaerales bacterium]
MSAGIWFCLAGLLLIAPRSSATVGSNKCFVCGNVIYRGTIYLTKDEITLEKVEVCSVCEAEFPDCYWCGIPANTNTVGFVSLPDGRAICARDARTVVLNENEVIEVAKQVREDLARLLSRFTTLPETNVVFGMVDRVHLEDLFKIAGRDYHCPNVWGYTDSITNKNQLEHQISLLSGLPRTWLKATCAHELTHAWMAERLSASRKDSLARDAQEGFCELVAYTYMDSLHDEEQKAMILRNGYTCGQIDLFVDAANRFGLNDVVEWVKFGTDSALDSSDGFRIHNLQTAPRPHPAITVNPAPMEVRETSAPSTLRLKAVFWSETQPLALINDHTFGLHDKAKLRLGTNNVTVECTMIRPNTVKVFVTGADREEELSLKSK